ncbi:MAG TPA: nucleotidyltransferase domain-containing protein [Chitinivibrionales bacterium]|jgi:predicted nucleotidyltransferase|nr:nucleotidyltransferase domain-containing protein [Chitinivibrionales bacterium]
MTDELNALIHKAARVLRSFGATDVYLFGSIAHGANDEHSDIDLAVSGLPPKVFFKAMGSTLNVLKREFDLVDLDEKNPFVDHLKSRGDMRRVI